MRKCAAWFTIGLLFAAMAAVSQNIGGGINNPGSSGGGSGTTTGPGGTPTTNDILTSTGTAQQVQDPGVCTMATGSLNCPAGTVYSVNSDTGISRVLAGEWALGNGTANNTQGNLLLNGWREGATSSTTGADFGLKTSGTYIFGSLGVLTFSSNTINSSLDTSISRSAANTVAIGTGTQGNSGGSLVAANLTASAAVSGATHLTATNCSSSASPAVCGSAAAGSVAVPTGATPTLVIDTSAVTANSQILLTIDESLGTKLSVTCNSTLATLVQPVVTARTGGTSFTIQINATLATNPACVSYLVVN